VIPAVTIGAPVGLSVALLLLVTAQRLAELVIAKRNTAALMAQGAVEHGAGHYPAIVLLHAAWLIGLWLFAAGLEPSLPLAALYLVLQAFRVWTLASIGPRWTTRVIVVPGETLVARGPYRFMRHPNYAVVVAEILVLPLVFGLGAYALLFSLLNACVLAVRIGVEERALAATRRPG
jgi:methyltransferase